MNPWLVENIQEFLFLNCPECAFKSKEENIFQDHAVKNHSLSHIFFGQDSEVGYTNFLTGEISNATVVNRPDRKNDKFTTVQRIESEFVTIKTEIHSEVSIEEKIIDPLEKIPIQEFIISDIKTEELEDITVDIDLSIDEGSLNLDKNVSKIFNNQSTNINNLNVFTPESQEIIPIEKFPKKDKTTSIFKCQIPPKKSTSKPMIMKNYPLAKSYSISASKDQKSGCHSLKKQDLDIRVKDNEIVVEKNLASTLHLENIVKSISPTYTCLITEALNNAPNGALVGADSICKAINTNHPEYKMDNDVWKTDVRNNLSINKKFIQEGKYWKLAQHSSISTPKVQIKIMHPSNKQDLDNITESNEIGGKNMDSTSYHENVMKPEKVNDYVRMIAEALNNAPTGALILEDIHRSINARHPQSRVYNDFCKTVVKNNLLINKNFVQEGEYWKLAPDNLISKFLINPDETFSEEQNVNQTERRGANRPEKVNYYGRMIEEALNHAPTGALILADIYKAINARHPQYKRENNGLKADITNTLWINKNFIQDGKYWKLASDDSISVPKVQKNESNSLNKQNLDSIAESNEIGEKSLDSVSYSFKEKNTYFHLIAKAFKSFPDGVLLLPNSIYKAINARHPQYKMDNDVWKTDVKNNLLINKNFVQEGEYWKLAPDNSISKFLINPDNTISEKENVDQSEKSGTKRPYTMSELSAEIPEKIIREEEVPTISKLWTKCPNKFCNFGAEEEHVIEKHMRIVHINQCPHCDFSCKKGAGLKGFSAMADHIEKEHKDIEKLVRKSITLSIPSISSEVLLDMNSQVKSFQKEATQTLSDQGSSNDLR